MVGNPRTQEQPLTTISVAARRTEFCAELRAESRSKYRSEFRSFFTTFIHVFSQVVADVVVYTLDCSLVAILFSFIYFWSGGGSRLDWRTYIGRAWPAGKEGNRLMRPATSLKLSIWPYEHKTVGHPWTKGLFTAH